MKPYFFAKKYTIIELTDNLSKSKVQLKYLGLINQYKARNYLTLVSSIKYCEAIKHFITLK